MCRKAEIKDTVQAVETQSTAAKAKQLAPTHSDFHRNTDYDWLIFLGPLLAFKFTNVVPIYAIAIARFFVNHANC